MQQAKAARLAISCEETFEGTDSSRTQESQQASHLELNWTARHDPSMIRKGGYCTERTRANTQNRQKEQQAPILVPKCRQNPKKVHTNHKRLDTARSHLNHCWAPEG